MKEEPSRHGDSRPALMSGSGTARCGRRGSRRKARLGTTGDALHAAKLVVGLAKLVVARDGGRSGGLRDFSE